MSENVHEDLQKVHEDLQDQVLGVVRRSQEVTLAAVKRAVEILSAATAKLPARRLDGREHKLPFAGRLPEVPEAGTVVNSAFDFAGRLLAEERAFAEELVKATAPLRHRAQETQETQEIQETQEAAAGTPEAQEAPKAPNAPAA